MITFFIYLNFKHINVVEIYRVYSNYNKGLEAQYCLLKVAVFSTVKMRK